MGNEKQAKPDKIIVIIVLIIVIAAFVYGIYYMISSAIEEDAEEERQRQLRSFKENERSRKMFDWCSNNQPNISLEVVETRITPVDSQRTRYNCCYTYLDKVDGAFTTKQICWALEN